MSPDVPEVDAPTKVAVAEQRELLRDGAAVLTWVRRFAPVLRRGGHGRSLRPLRCRSGEEQNDKEGGDGCHASSGQSHDLSLLLPESCCAQDIWRLESSLSPVGHTPGSGSANDCSTWSAP